MQRAIEEWTRRSADDGGVGAGAVGSGSVNAVGLGAACGRDGGGVGGDGVESSAVLEDELAAKIAELSAGTGMNREFSRQCLEECAWSLELAFEAFRRVREAGMLPEVALSG
ncbi:poly(A)+ mRNA export from nucleus [Sparganum proliferum]